MGCSKALFAKFLLLLTAFLGACSHQPETSPRDAADANDTGKMLGPADESERALLRQLSSLPNGAAQRVGNATVLAEAPYEAASGRTCRALHVRSAPQGQRERRRLVCNDGKAWYFVPDVFGSNAGE